jgi:hypothetical protein
VTTGSQVFGGVKTFSNGFILPSAGGTNQNSRFVNIGTIHEGSAGSTQIGFNNSNNIYFGKGLSNGGVIQWTNAAVRYYTLPDADGTLALTSDLGNYIQGVGTADSIPKFTGTRTIANSAIRDTTSTVVISKNVSVDNGASQAINLTPASGGTTNRIETTGTLPLSLVTSGSSITLAAGGVTPQITLASSGSATFTGDISLSGASGTRSLNITSNTSGNPTINLIAAGVDSATISYNRSTSELNFANSGATSALKIASTGAATFSNKVGVGGASATYSLTAYNSANGTTAAFGGTQYGIRIDNGGAFSGGRSTIFGVDNTFYGSYQPLSIEAQSLALNAATGGNVGIGTASPLQLLHVKLDQNAYTWSRIDNQANNSSAYAGLQLGANGNTWGLACGSSAANSNSLTFLIDAGGSNVERMRITSGGNVLVGVNATGPYLDGQITSSVPSGTLPAACFKNLTSTQFVASFWNSASSGDNVFQMFVTDSSPTIRGTISYNRAAGLVAYNTTSDYRLKTEIEDFEALSIIKNLKPKEFRVLDSENKSIGFIAHELQEFYPQAVTGEKDAVDEEGNPKYQGVDYSQLTGLLVKAIQELKTEIDSLKNQIK